MVLIVEGSAPKQGWDVAIPRPTSVSRFHAEICSAEALLALAAELHASGPQSAFNSPHWLGPLIEILAPHASAEIIGLVVRRRDDEVIAGILPLAVTRENGCRTVRFADFGVTDYAAPLLGPAAPTNAADVRVFQEAVRVALALRYDLIRFERQPQMIGDRPNPLATHPGAVASRTTGNSIVIAESVQTHVADLGRKVRKEVERCKRHFAAAGTLTLERGRDVAEVISAFNRLEALQSARWTGIEGRYRLDELAYGHFYRDVIARGTLPGFAEVLTFSAGGIPVGAVFGIRSSGRFTVLRIATDDPQWGRYSPGRLTLLAALEDLVAQGIRTFDLGIGDYAFKRRLGAEPVPLVDLTMPLSWAAVPVVAYLRTKAFLRSQPALKRLADRIRGRV